MPGRVGRPGAPPSARRAPDELAQTLAERDIVAGTHDIGAPEGQAAVEKSRTPARSQRQDWQRNHERLLAVAAQVVAKDGFEASLEEIARRAGIGSATLHRHFPSRHALLEEIFHDGVDRLCRRADDLAGEPSTGLTRWLEELAIYSAETRGLAASLIAERPDLAVTHGCHGQLLDTAQELVRRACAAGAVRPDVSATDLLTITNAVSLVSEGDPDSARRLIRLAVDGVKP